jgi:uncharacterized protein YjbJ (UPF0337 family)
MSETDLSKLEWDVVQARTRFAGDLARLRSPQTLTEFKDDVIGTAKDAATDNANSLVATLKGKANANPAAVLAIGAGLAWRLSRHPPIATVLVGLGLWSLWRTTPAPEGEGFGPRTVELAHAAQDKVQELREQAGDAISQFADQAAAKADQVSTSVRATVHDIQDAAIKAAGTARERVHDLQDAARTVAGQASSIARDTASSLQDKAGSAGERVSSFAGSAMETASALAGSARANASALVHDRTPDEVSRDTLLLGAAAMAVTAAVGIAYQRRG